MAGAFERVEETKKAKYDLETYLGSMRDKLAATDHGSEKSLASFCQEGEITEFLKKLDEVRGWLDAEGREQPKENYDLKLAEVKSIGDIFEKRKNEFEKLLTAIQNLESRLDYWDTTASPNNIDEKYSHIVSFEREKVCTKCSEYRKWLQEQKKQLETPLSVDLDVTTVTAIISGLDNFAERIMNQPKPVAKKTESVRRTGSKDAEAHTQFIMKSPFPNLFSPDVEFVISGIDRVFPLHIWVLTSASKMFEEVFKGRNTRCCCTYDARTRRAEWNCGRLAGNKVYADVLVKWLNFCYGLDLSFSVDEYMAAFVALLQLRLKCNEAGGLLKKLEEGIKTEAEKDVDFGVRMLEESFFVYGDINDSKMAKLRDTMVQIVMKPVNFEKHFKTVVLCLIKLPSCYLDIAKYGEDHSERSEFNIRALYVECNKLTREEKCKIMRGCLQKDLDDEELRKLEEMNILEKYQMKELYRKAKDRKDREQEMRAREQQQLRAREQQQMRAREQQQSMSGQQYFGVTWI